jgi:ribosomal protein L24E
MRMINCEYCGRAFPVFGRGRMYCGASCKVLSVRRRKRARLQAEAEREKKAHGGDRKSRCQNDTLIPERTAGNGVKMTPLCQSAPPDIGSK